MLRMAPIKNRAATEKLQFRYQKLGGLGPALPPVPHESNLFAVDAHVTHQIASEPAHHRCLARNPGVERERARWPIRIQGISYGALIKQLGRFPQNGLVDVDLLRLRARRGAA